MNRAEAPPHELTMRAVVATADGPALETLPVPSPGPDEILVDVKAAALNRYDLKMGKGASHGDAGGIGTAIGMEWAGEVALVGSAVDRWAVGDRVMGVSPGSFAEHTLAPAATVFPMWTGLDWEVAATLPVGLQTMHDALVTQAGFKAGQSVLVQGAASGMGLMGLQIARELGASLIVGTSTSPARLARLTQFGADLALDSRSADWVDQVHGRTGGQGVDVVLDLVAGPLVTDTLRATRIGGVVVNIGRVGGETASIDLDLHSLRRITYRGTTFRTRSRDQVADVVRRATEALEAAVTKGRVCMPVHATYPLARAEEAFAAMEANTHFGKLVLVP